MGKKQGIFRTLAVFRKNRAKKLHDSKRFHQNSLRGRTGDFFGRAGKSNSTLGGEQGYLISHERSVDAIRAGIRRSPKTNMSLMGLAQIGLRMLVTDR
jgi:hypothetical protein